jgi:hypothetical protein
MGEGNKQLTALELFRGSKECPHLALSALLASVNLEEKQRACLPACLEPGGIPPTSPHPVWTKDTCSCTLSCTSDHYTLCYRY